MDKIKCFLCLHKVPLADSVCNARLNTFLLNQLLEMPHLMSSSKDRLEAIVFCSPCSKKITTIQETLLHIERMEKIVLYEKYLIESQFNFKEDYIQDMNDSIRLLDFLWNICAPKLQLLRSATFGEMLTKLQQGKAIGPKSKYEHGSDPTETNTRVESTSRIGLETQKMNEEEIESKASDSAQDQIGAVLVDLENTEANTSGTSKSAGSGSVSDPYHAERIRTSDEHRSLKHAKTHHHRHRQDQCRTSPRRDKSKSEHSKHKHRDSSSSSLSIRKSPTNSSFQPRNRQNSPHTNTASSLKRKDHDDADKSLKRKREDERMDDNRKFCSKSLPFKDSPSPSPTKLGHSVFNKTCLNCEDEIVFLSMQAWLAHCLNVHPNGFTCTLCSYHCRVHSDLKDHMVTYSSERNFRCELCDGAFKLSKALRRHILEVHGENPRRFKQN